MYPVDVLTAFAVCGAASLVGAALLRPAMASDELGAEALHITRGSFGVLGLGLVHVVALDAPHPLWSQALMALGGVASVGMVGWALAALGGQRAPRSGLWLMLAVVAAAALAAWPLGTPGMVWFCALGLALASTLITAMGRRVVLRPRDVHERLLGMTVLAMLLLSWLRASFLLTWHAPYEPHLLHLPPDLVAPFMLMYGVLPILFTTLLANVIGGRLNARLHQRAMTDPLTGALSRLALAEGAAGLLTRLQPGGPRLAVVMIDLDHFKQINDRHGHAGGDTVLRHSAALLQSELRAEALLARYGGEEFVALVPVEGLPVARRVAERLRAVLEGAEWPALVPGLTGVTASLGVAVLEPGEPLEQALARADEALYRAKHGGRNQVQVALAAA